MWFSSPVYRLLFHTLGNILPQKYGLNLRLEPIIWSRGLDLVKAGLADGIIDASYQDKRAKHAGYPMIQGKLDTTKILRRSRYLLYINKESTIQWDGTTFSNIDGPIASIKSYAIVQDLKEIGVNVLEMQRELAIIKDVYIGKLAAAALPETITGTAFKQLPYLKENIKIHTPPLSTKDYYLIFSKHFYKQNTEYAEEIWSAYKHYRLSREYKALEAELGNGK